MMPRQCAAAEERFCAGPLEKKVLWFREGALGTPGCEVSETYRHRAYSDSAREYR
jgi:hypothetical protein